MITIKLNKGIDSIEYYIEPVEIKFLKKIERKYTNTTGVYNTSYSIKIDDNWESIDESVFNEIMIYKNAISRQKIMDNILDEKN